MAVGRQSGAELTLLSFFGGANKKKSDHALVDRAPPAPRACDRVRFDRGALLRRGQAVPRARHPIWIGAALANVVVESSFLSAVWIASGNTLEALAAATLIRR